jgi:hypothetical protein
MRKQSARETDANARNAGKLKILLLVVFFILFGPIVLLAIPIYAILWVVLRPFRAGASVLRFLKNVILLPFRIVAKILP